jgi:hypothetical protein
MLKKALTLIARGEASSLDELAAELQLTRLLAEQLVDRLVENGYLREVDASAGMEKGCAGCSLRSWCEGRTSTRLWEVTPKGMAAAETGAAH